MATDIREALAAGETSTTLADRLASKAAWAGTLEANARHVRDLSGQLERARRVLAGNVQLARPHMSLRELASVTGLSERRIRQLEEDLDAEV